MGWSPSGLVITWAFRVWRYRCYSIFAASFPFFFFKGFQSQGASLAGYEIDESKNSQLPSLRQNLVKRPVERKKFGKPEDGQVSSVWQLKKLESCKTLYSYRDNSALLLQRLRFTFFRAVNSNIKIPFFFSVQSDRRLSS